MIDFPITDLLDDSICLIWLERYLHPDGLKCPHAGHTEQRWFRPQQCVPAYRCRACDGSYTLLTGTAFAKPRQRPTTLVLLWRGMTKGEPTARLARELGLEYACLAIVANWAAGCGDEAEITMSEVLANVEAASAGLPALFEALLAG